MAVPRKRRQRRRLIALARHRQRPAQRRALRFRPIRKGRR